jgi:hypothetical protein
MSIYPTPWLLHSPTNVDRRHVFCTLYFCFILRHIYEHNSEPPWGRSLQIGPAMWGSVMNWTHFSLYSMLLLCKIIIIIIINKNKKGMFLSTYICIIRHINERSRQSLRNVGFILRIDVSDQPETLQRIKKQLRLRIRSNGANISDWLANSKDPKYSLRSYQILRWRKNSPPSTAPDLFLKRS